MDEQCEDPHAHPNLGPEDYSTQLFGEENEYYDLILCFKDGNYHIADLVAVDTETSLVELCRSDGSEDFVEEEGRRFYDSEQEIGSDVSARDELQELKETILDLHLKVTTNSEVPLADEGHLMGRKLRNSLASSSRTESGALSSWGAFAQNSGSISHSSNGSKQSVRSSFTFPTTPMAWNGTPARLPKARSDNPRKRLAWKLLFLCCRH